MERPKGGLETACASSQVDCTARSGVILAQLETMKAQLRALSAIRAGGATHSAVPSAERRSTSVSPKLSGEPESRRRSVASPAFRVPMTAAQKQLWIMSMLSEQGSAACNLCSALRSSSPLDIGRIKDTIGALLLRHPLLRAKPDEDGEHLVSIPAESPQRPATLAVFDAMSDAEVQEALGTEACRPFDVTDGPLFRFVLVRAQGHFYVMLVAHHIVVDGRTCQILLEDFAEHYERQGSQPLRGEDEGRLLARYKEWLQESAERTLQSGATDYWKDRFSLPVPPVSFLQGAQETGEAYGAVSRQFELGDVMALVDQASRRAKVSRFMFITAAFARLLHRISGAEQLLIGIPIARIPPEPLTNFVTCTTDIGLIRSEWHSRMSPSEHLRIVASDILTLLDQAGFGYAEALDRNLIPIDAPIPAMITLERSVPRNGNSPFQFWPSPPPKRSFQGISMVLHESGSTLSCELTVQLSVAPAEILDTFARELPLTLSVLAADRHDAR